MMLSTLVSRIPSCMFVQRASTQRPRSSISISAMNFTSTCQESLPTTMAPELALYMEHVKRCNRGTQEERSKFLPFVVDDVHLGFIHSNFLQQLLIFPKVFSVVSSESTDQEEKVSDTNLCAEHHVTLHHDLRSYEDRTSAINKCLKVLNGDGIIDGWRNEMYPVSKELGDPPFFCLERAATKFFGVKAYGVHVNGFVIDGNGKKCIWVAKRSPHKETYPGMLDHLVAGGQPAGISFRANVVKECDEEASIPEVIAQRAVPVSAIAYEDVKDSIFKREILFCYDLQLPESFQPHNKDGEVESFSLLSVEEVQKILQTSRAYKPNCSLVVIDFLFRHGYITPDQPGYFNLMQSLRTGKCV